MKPMKHLLSVLILVMIGSAHAGITDPTKCFVLKNKDKIMAQEGDCTIPYSPYGTFKIPLSLMGYDSGLLIDTTHPELVAHQGFVNFLGVWKRPVNPKTWISDSVIWYSQVLTQELGMDKFKHYVQVFDYGNKDLSGDPGKNNGLSHAWLGSSLGISGLEQVNFLQKVSEGKFPVSKKSYEMSKQLFYQGELGGL